MSNHNYKVYKFYESGNDPGSWMNNLSGREQIRDRLDRESNPDRLCELYRTKIVVKSLKTVCNFWFPKTCYRSLTKSLLDETCTNYKQITTAKLLENVRNDPQSIDQSKCFFSSLVNFCAGTQGKSCFDD